MSLPIPDMNQIMGAMGRALMADFMVAVLNPAGRVVFANRELATTLGVSVDALRGQDLSSLVVHADGDADLAQITAFLHNGRSWLGKLMLRRAGGDVFTVQVSLLPHSHPEGGLTHFIMVASAVARRLAFPISTTSPQDQFFSLLEGLGTPTLLHRDNQILYANEAARLLLDATHTQLRQWPYDQLAAPEGRAALLARVQARAQGRGDQSGQTLPLLTLGGEARWVEQTTGIVQIDGQPTLLDTFVDRTASRAALAAEAHTRQVLAHVIDGNPVPTFVIGADHVVTHWNRACELISGMKASDVIGTTDQWKAFYPAQRPTMADLIASGALEKDVDLHYHNKFRHSTIVPDAFEAEDFFPGFGHGGKWLHFTAAPLRDRDGHITGAIETLVDVTERRLAEEALRSAQTGLEHLVAERTTQLAQANTQLAADVAQRRQAEAQLRQRNGELEHLNTQLSQAHEQLVQSEKLASIGQLAAGVAHEINNPIGYVHSNIGSLQTYLTDLFALLDAYEQLPANPDIEAMRRKVDVEFLREDIPSLIRESQEGIGRVKKIVQDLKDFSRVDSTQEWQSANLHQGIDSTLNIVNNEIKYRADVVKAYGALPLVECLPSQLNQVFMNLMVNAAHAMGDQRGTITIRTGVSGDHVWLEFADTGSGISKENLSRIFDPFFTTKPVGKGTGLGLSLTYGIVQKHHGHIEVQSELGKGTVFRIVLPVQQPSQAEPEEAVHG